jgi:hypothetical protein
LDWPSVGPKKRKGKKEKKQETEISFSAGVVLFYSLPSHGNSFFSMDAVNLIPAIKRTTPSLSNYYSI